MSAPADLPVAALRPPLRALLGLATWGLAWAAMLWLDDHLELGNKAVLLVLAAAVSALWWPAWAALSGCTAAVLAFNLAFVPPRGTFSVDLRHHALLLGTMLAVSWIVALLMARQRRLAAEEREHARRARQLRELGDALRESPDPREQLGRLQQLLADAAGGDALLLLPGPEGSDDPGQPAGASADERAGLRLCLHGAQAMGPGTGRHDELPAWYLPLRGRGGTCGAALLRLPPGPVDRAAPRREHAQALCDQVGAALERAAALQAAAQAHDAAQAQALRNTLLAAIAHDHRTPLATILGAASALHDQGERLSPAQRQRLAATIVDEASQLARLTDNTLQLARLESGELAIHRDWESVEELAGTVMRRMRQRDPARRLRARIEPGLPLLRCDAVLLVQLLDNLIDNALKYGGDAAPVELLARRSGDALLLAVRDRGPGVPPGERGQIFASFQRGAQHGAPADAPSRRGAGVGLAVCRAIAQAHGGQLSHRPRGHGGSAFELVLPLEPAPGAAEVQGVA